MRASLLNFGAMALSTVTANTYPDCEPDNCYRNLINPRFAQEIGGFCIGYLSESIIDIPQDYHNCAGDSQAIKSACSCITYSLTHTTSPSSATSTSASTSVYTTSSLIQITSSSSSAEPVTSGESTTRSNEGTATSTTSYSTSTPLEISTSTPTENSKPEPPISSSTSAASISTTSSSKTDYTTSTIYAITEYKITTCAPTIPDCFSAPHVTTSTYILSTTICPVAPFPTSTPTGPVTSKYTYYTTETHSSSGHISTIVYPTSTGIVTIVVPTQIPGETLIFNTLPPFILPSVAPGTGGAPTKTASSTGLGVTAAAAKRLSGGVEMLVGAGGAIVVALL
ncbi:uncharacterized protein RCO7_00723 [Rhynchosporium graminicola]|uniref:Extracellular membrane protein CFEM domain-containing protein n=1 Tax=Rhynchosporium graminicola TaxID=2792576 RepID=A0A1E1K262_9HELO|nr:uncharacterized protein RCO7_00723 [Rhynchosporium commune]